MRTNRPCDWDEVVVAREKRKAYEAKRLARQIKKEKKAISDAKPAQVYQWRNVETGKCYVGYKTHPVGDYVASSQRAEFWADHEKGLLERSVLFEGRHDECRKYEAREILSRLEELYNDHGLKNFIKNA